MQVRTFAKDQDFTEQDLRDLASQHGVAGDGAKAVEAGDFSGLTLAYDADNVFWRHWYVASGRQALVISYTCGVRDKEREIAQIGEMLASLADT